MEESMKKALIKRAAGYIQKEISEEYIEQEGGYERYSSRPRSFENHFERKKRLFGFKRRGA